MERIEFDLLFRWFVGIGSDDPVWDDCVEKLGEPLLPVIFEFAALVWQNNDAHGGGNRELLLA